MSRLPGLAVAAAVLAFAGSAEAARYYEVTVTGVLTQELGLGPDPMNTGVDANFSVGKTLTLSARFREDQVATFQSQGLSVAGFRGPTSGSEFWRIDGEGFVWSSYDEYMDGEPLITVQRDYIASDGTTQYDTRYIPGPLVMFAGGKVVGLQGVLGEPMVDKPKLSLGSSLFNGVIYEYNTVPGGPLTRTESIGYLSTTDVFQLLPGYGEYGNNYNSQGFQGRWDFTGSTVTLTGVPEPGTWAMLIAGFGLAGAALRAERRRRRTDDPCAPAAA